MVPGKVPLGRARLPPRRRDAEKTKQIDNFSASQRLCGKISPYPDTKSSHSSDSDRGHETGTQDAITKAKSRRAEADGCCGWVSPSWCSVVPGGVDVSLHLHVPNTVRIPWAMPVGALTMAVGQCGVMGGRGPWALPKAKLCMAFGQNGCVLGGGLGCYRAGARWSRGGVWRVVSVS